MKNCMSLNRLKVRLGDTEPVSIPGDNRQTTIAQRAVQGLTLWAVLFVCVQNTQAINLQEFVTDVVNTNPLVREQVHAYRQVAQDHKIALSGWRPSLDISSTIGRSSRKAPNTLQRRSDFNESQADLTLTQNLFDGFNTTNQIAQARARISSAVYQLYDTADNVALEAVNAYFTVLTEKRLVALAAQSVDTHERIFSRINERHARGIGRLSDLEQTEGRLAQSHASLISQQNNLEDALTEVHKLVGRYISAKEFFDSSEPGALKESVEVLAEGAIVSHPAIQSAIYNIEAARFDYKRAKSSDLPSLNLQLQQSVGDNVGGSRGNLNEGSVMLFFEYNLYRGGADQAEQQKKISVMHENDAFLARVRRQVIDALRLSRTAHRALMGQLPFLERHAIKSEKTLELYGEEFLLQKRDLIDVLDAENELNRARGREAEAHYLVQFARYRIYEAQGSLFQPLEIKVEVSEDDFRVASISAKGTDTVELINDRDNDGIEDQQDQCGNTLAGSTVDAYGCRQQSKIEFGLSGVGLAPLVTDDVLAGQANLSLNISPLQLLENDNSPEGEVLVISRFTQPLSGTLDRDAEGNLNYIPNTDFIGEDKFSYTVSDTLGRTGRGQVVVWVKRVEVARPNIPEVEVVQFDYKQLTLTEESQARIDAIIGKLSTHPEVRIEAYAYTDNIGSAQYNRRLSEWRAQAMKQILINAGLDRQHITAVGKGENDPIADNSTEAGRASNRRGEFRFIFPAN